jgi:hypothetical protein
MRVIVAVKNGGGGAGASAATRYVATREPDEKIEGKRPRPLFSRHEDGLSYWKADRVLAAGGRPRGDDVLHLVVSFTEEDFDRLGEDEEARQAGLRSVTREAVGAMGRELKADELRWVAGIHRNTAHPHLHLLIRRDYLHRETGRGRRLGTLPKELRVSWGRTPEGGRVINPGGLSRAFETHLDRQIERANESRKAPPDLPSPPRQAAGARPPQAGGTQSGQAGNRHARGGADAREARQEIRPDEGARVREDRRRLGRGLIAEDRLRRLSERREWALAGGERRRVLVADAEGRERFLSEADLRRRATVRAGQVMEKLGQKFGRDEREEMRREVLRKEVAKEGELIARVREARESALTGIERRLAHAASVEGPRIREAAAVRQRYESRGQRPPTPLLSRAELSALQDRGGDAARVRELEEIRVSLAAEHGAPTRNDQEVGRLRARLLVAASALAVERESAARFEETKHVRSWPVTARGTGRRAAEDDLRFSLAGVERALARESDRARFIGERAVHWDENKRREAGERAEEFGRFREAVLDQIQGRRAQHADAVARQEQLVKSLGEIQAREQRRYRAEGLELPEPRLNPQDLRQLEAHAERLSHPAFWLTLARLERDSDARVYGAGQPPLPERTGRALAREVMAEIGLREAEAAREKFHSERERVDVVVRDDGGREIALGRLADVEPRGPLAHLLRPLLARGEGYRGVSAAVAAQAVRLDARCEQAGRTYEALRAVAREYAQEYEQAHPGEMLPRPAFMPSEISRLEQQAARESDPAMEARYEALSRDALGEARDEFGRRAGDFSPAQGLDTAVAGNAVGSPGGDRVAPHLADRLTPERDEPERADFTDRGWGGYER